MKLPTLTQAAKGRATFEWYSEGQLMYRLHWSDDDFASGTLDVLVPIDDAGGGHFTPIMKGLNLMRWIRKTIDGIKDAEAQQNLPGIT